MNNRRAAAKDWLWLAVAVAFELLLSARREEAERPVLLETPVSPNKARLHIYGLFMHRACIRLLKVDSSLQIHEDWQATLRSFERVVFGVWPGIRSGGRLSVSEIAAETVHAVAKLCVLLVQLRLVL